MEEVVEGVTERLSSVFEAGRASGLGEDDISQTIDSFYKELSKKEKATMPFLRIMKVSVLKAAYILLYRLLPLVLLLSSLYSQLQLLIQKDPCLLAQPMLHDFATKIIDCNSCVNITNAVTINSISVMDFMNNHATSLQPVLMKGAASNWPAMSIFSYEYFKGLYTKNPEAVTHDREEGQFFPYSSGIFTLDEFLSLDNETASFKGKKWYIGWSTTDNFVGEELRKHVKVPYFLPPVPSEDNLAWIFMGAPGPGAGLHIDFVGRVSWQAQLSGKKTWTLAPPPECETTCSTFNVTVDTGDIIVIDTNSWFHATFIHPGNVSITFGAEFE
ncbi:PREDICTED: uncharacterized protein LOC100641282 [Amphimedon queenslandica]|uniref:Cupin-like domain-containing protein n=1 Tax=Amphimedon queenslandica TaxID=400682 RepID=A0A1X7VSY9_AMPQE|nr:PREDICTED: uncharacterized protein LOC100641282 [Amphimedon queenslandica]|eukprot:XP_003382910.1 PREDICTED: uncharacterized protein LOC100641282 [Amphimedon queenslandica]